MLSTTRDLHSHRHVARAPDGTLVSIKQILPHLTQHPSFMAHLLADTRDLERLRHPNILATTALHFDRANDEMLLVMEHVVGADLGTLVRTGPIGRELGAWIVAEACAGLHAAHDLGLWHRDMRPSHIWVGTNGSVKLFDFGLARAGGTLVYTASGVIKHRYDCMAPEQCKGFWADRRSDLWSLGVVLYEITTHTRLFRRESDFETIKAILRDPVPPLPPGYPAALAACVMKALEKDPDGRFATALELRDAVVASMSARDYRAELVALTAGSCAPTSK